MNVLAGHVFFPVSWQQKAVHPSQHALPLRHPEHVTTAIADNDRVR